jgi:AbrB family looped-hinge helix DNA binding protein
MNAKIDQFGRVVLPKQLRKRFGMEAGTQLEIVEATDGLLLRVKGRASGVEEVDGRLVYCGELPEEFNILEAIATDREDRDAKLIGLSANHGQ